MSKSFQMLGRKIEYSRGTIILNMRYTPDSFIFLYCGNPMPLESGLLTCSFVNEYISFYRDVKAIGNFMKSHDRYWDTEKQTAGMQSVL